MKDEGPQPESESGANEERAGKKGLALRERNFKRLPGPGGASIYHKKGVTPDHGRSEGQQRGWKNSSAEL